MPPDFVERKFLRLRPVLRRALATAGLAVMRVDQSADEVTPVHGHDLLELAFIERGRLAQRLDGRSIDCAAGSLLVMPLGSQHGYEVAPGGCLLWNLLIDRDHVPRPALPPELRRPFERLLAAPGAEPFLLDGLDLAPALSAIHREQQRCAAGWIQALSAQFALIAITICRTLEAGGARPLPHGDARIEALCQAIADEPSRTWALADLSARSGLERGALIRAFRRWRGCPPAAFVRQERLRRARTLILAGSDLADAAAASGYGSAAALAHAARRVTGASPASWRGRTINRKRRSRDD